MVFLKYSLKDQSPGKPNPCVTETLTDKLKHGYDRKSDSVKMPLRGSIYFLPPPHLFTNFQIKFTRLTSQ